MIWRKLNKNRYPDLSKRHLQSRCIPHFLFQFKCHSIGRITHEPKWLSDHPHNVLSQTYRMYLTWVHMVWWFWEEKKTLGRDSATKFWLEGRIQVRQTHLPQILISPQILVTISKILGNLNNWYVLRFLFPKVVISGDLPLQNFEPGRRVPPPLGGGAHEIGSSSTEFLSQNDGLSAWNKKRVLPHCLKAGCQDAGNWSGW